MPSPRSKKKKLQFPKKIRLIVRKLPHLSKQQVLVAGLGFLLLFILLIVYLFKDVPNPTKLTRTPAPVSTQILDRNHRLLYEIYAEKNRTPVSLKDLPPYVAQGTIAIEDKNFYHHHGLDFLGITRAFINTLSGKRLEGGSTITQQLVKMALLDDPSRTITRKVREAALSILTEIIYSKDQILELYLNQAPYGGTAYGIETASLQFFNKSSKDLTLAEASLLVGLPQSPTRYSPFGAHPELAKNRQQQVLRRMVEDGYITKDQADTATNTPLVYASSQTRIEAPHFVLWVRELLVDRYGEDAVNLGGLRVTTSLDLDIQHMAQSSVSAEINKLTKLKISNGAALVTKPNTGEIIAMVGSRNYFDIEHDGNVNVTLRYRQPGSSIKPINYATGLLNGWPASTTYLDIPTCFSQTGQPQYCPKNYDSTFHGPVQMRFALGNSYNIPAVKQLAMNGIESLIATASAMGITGWDDPSHYGLSLTLGGGEVRPIDMAVAFGVFANAGVKVPLNPILKVETFNGHVLEELDTQQLETTTQSIKQNWTDFWTNPQKQPLPLTTSPLEIKTAKTKTYLAPKLLETDIKTVLPEEVSFIISHILLDNNARAGAFGTNSQLVIPGKTVSVKTGTTNDLRDNWTVGYNPDFLVLTWVGNNDNSPMSYVASGVTGASTIWNQIIRQLLKGQKDHFPAQPPGVISQQICTLTGLLPTPESPCETRTELFIKNLPLPITYPIRKQVWLRRDNKLPVIPGDNVIDMDLEEHTVISDPFVKDFCLDCNYPRETQPDPQNPTQTLDSGKISYPTINVNYDIFRQKLPAFGSLYSSP